jgi:hypothetical protein
MGRCGRQASIAPMGRRQRPRRGYSELLGGPENRDDRSSSFGMGAPRWPRSQALTGEELVLERQSNSGR